MDSVDIQSITGIIGSVGVPGALCFYVLTMLKKSIDENTKAITLLAFKMGVPMDGGQFK